MISSGALSALLQQGEAEEYIYIKEISLTSNINIIEHEEYAEAHAFIKEISLTSNINIIDIEEW